MPRRAQQRVPVLAVLVCHDGRQWLTDTFAALDGLTVGPRHVIAVDAGSTDGTREAVAACDRLDEVVGVPADTGFGDAVRAALAAADARYPEPDPWVWLLHDDSAPEPDCLRVLLDAGELSPTAAVLGPLCLDWHDPRRIVEAGLSTDASGHRQTGVGPEELDLGQFAQNAEVLAVGSAGSLVRREVWDALGGYDPALPMLRDDLDFGWRANRAGHPVFCVPRARLRHAVAGGTRQRPPDAVGGRYRTADRRHALRTVLVNCSTMALVTGLLRLPVLCLLRAGGFLLLRRTGAARAELAALRYVVGGAAGLRAGRRLRRPAVVVSSRDVRALLTSRTTRLRNGVRGGLAGLVRRRLRTELALGRLPARAVPAPPPATPRASGARFGPSALPAGAVAGLRAGEGQLQRTAGLRPPARSVAVAVGPGGTLPRPGQASPAPPGSALRGSALPGAALPGSTDGSGLVVLPVGRRRVARELLLAPPPLLVLALTAISLAAQHGRLGLALSGGRLLPPAGLGATWSSYLAEWHQVDGGTAAPAPTALAVLGVIGAPFAAIGGPAAAVSLMLLGALPLAGLTAYLATRRVRVSRWGRAACAVAYALSPVLTAAVAQGRLDVVVAVVLLPPVLAGVVAVLRGPPPGARPSSWLSVACATALALAVVSAFAPLVHLVVLVIALAGFVLTAAAPGYAMRRALGLFIVVLLPLGLLLPWPAVVLAHTVVLLHGVGSRVAQVRVGVGQLLTLDPGGPGRLPVVGVLLLAAALLVTVLRRRRAVLPGLALAALGIGVAAVVNHLELPPLSGGTPRPGWTGAPLAVAACGALWTVLAGMARTVEGEPRQPGRGVRATVTGAAAAVVVALAVGVLLRGGAGPLAAGPTPGLDPAVAGELRQAGTAVVDVAADGSVRSAPARLPSFGDDDLAPVGAEPQRLARDITALTTAEPAAARAAVADLGTGGVALLALPDAATAQRVRTAAGPLLADGAPTSDGRPTLRVRLPVGGAVLVEPPLSDDATHGGGPPETPGAKGVTPIPDRPPTIAARVSAGAADRLLVVAGADEPGWFATVNGKPVPVVQAWGHLAAVPVPAPQSDVRVDRSGALRALLLVIEAALLLFTVVAALPGRRRADD